MKNNESLSYLEASRIVANHTSSETTLAEDKVSEKIEYVLAASCQLEKLDVFIKAHSIKNNFISDYSLLSFNTLNQYLMSPNNDSNHLFLLFPWDLCPALDWRLGISNESLSVDNCIEQAALFLSRLNQIKIKKVIYFDFKIPPTLLDRSSSQVLRLRLAELAISNDAILGKQETFSLNSYLSIGCPFSSSHLSDVASQAVKEINKKTANKKVLITDFDNVMWRGVIGEDGLDGIQHEAHGAGYVHYVYQTYLKKLKNAGILIAGVTRNDEKLANWPFDSGIMPLKKDDFVAIMASYNAKSSQIIALSEQLNLPLDSFIFVDDNPLELEEVSNRCPQIECIAFPKKAEDFIFCLEKIVSYFNIKGITQEDSSRTELYRARAAAVIPSTDSGADLTDFLAALDMKIQVKHCSLETSTRPIQLINKTNQFNANGNRTNPEDTESLLEQGKKLVSFGLADKHGNHGEIAVILFDENNLLEYFVMSCRVFQRRVEFFILLWIYKNMQLKELEIIFKETEKNLPFQEFLSMAQATEVKDSRVLINLESFFEKHKDVLELFSVTSA